MKSILLILALVACGSLDHAFSQDKVKEHPDRKDVAGIDGEDREMIAAQEKARKSLMGFIEALQKREKNKRYLLKVKLEEGDKVEHVWLEPVKWNEPGLLGILAVDPVAIKKHKKGDVIAPSPADVSDWVILSADGTKKGGFTADVIEKRRAETKQSDQGDADQPATTVKSKSEDKEKAKLKSKAPPE